MVVVGVEVEVEVVVGVGVGVGVGVEVEVVVGVGVEVEVVVGVEVGVEVEVVVVLISLSDVSYPMNPEQQQRLRLLREVYVDPFDDEEIMGEHAVIVELISLIESLEEESERHLALVAEAMKHGNAALRGEQDATNALHQIMSRLAALHPSTQ